jgi:phosphate-selective porin OprO/OprP
MFRSFALMAALVTVAAPVFAQAPTPAAAAPVPPTPPPPTSGFDNGFFVQTPDGNTRLTFGFVAQTDGRFSVDDPLPITNTFTIRKIRPTFTGRLTKYFEFKVMPDFGNGTTIIQDAYFDTRFVSASGRTRRRSATSC